MDLSIVIVNYNNLRVLRTCLASLDRVPSGLAAETILSDNGSTDGSLTWVRRAHPHIRILRNGRNLGFAEANNRAFKVARGRNVLLLNPDTVLLNDAVGPMLRLLAGQPRAGVVGCRLLNADGSRQISARAFPDLLSYWLHFSGLDHRYPRSRFCGRFNMTYWEGTSARQVDWVSGAALMARREVLDRLGGLDRRLFLTYDDVDLCRRVKDAGYEVWYTPEGVILHLDRQSEPQSNPKPEARIKYLTVERNSRVRYFAKHYGVSYAALVELLHVFMCMGLLFKAKALGTQQSSTSMMEKQLVLKLYWRTALHAARLFCEGCVKHLGRATAAPRAPLLVNPYVPHER